MPTDVAPPPVSSATVKEVRIVEGAPPKPLTAPTREIRASDIDKLPGETRTESNRSAFRKNLESKSRPGDGGEIVPTPGDQPGKPAEKTADQKATEQAAADEAARVAVEESNQNKGQTQELDPKTGKPKKANPWKLFDEEKKKRGEAEAEVQRLKTSVVPDQERGALMDRVTKAETRTKELEDHIRFVSYEKSKEFQDQYQAPYEAAWKRATTELAEISITDPITNQPRAVTSQDILELVNMPLGKAREVADEVFRRFADDVMAHRKEIKGLFEKQTNALEDAKKNGGTRDQQQREAFQKQQTQIREFVAKSWKDANEGFLSDKVNAEYFKPKTVEEGQTLTPEEEEWNSALERGYKLVDDAWGSNAMAANLTPEQRQAIIKKNVAVRNRAAAFGPLKRLTTRLKAKVAQLESDLSKYQGSTPGAGGSTPQAGGQQPISAKEAFSARLRKVAH